MGCRTGARLSNRVMARNETRCTLQQRQWRSFFITGFWGFFLPASRGVFDYRHDTLDDFSLPQQGIYFDLEYLISKDSFDGSNPFLEMPLFRYRIGAVWAIDRCAHLFTPYFSRKLGYGVVKVNTHLPRLIRKASVVFSTCRASPQ